MTAAVIINGLDVLAVVAAGVIVFVGAWYLEWQRRDLITRADRQARVADFWRSMGTPS